MDRRIFDLLNEIVFNQEIDLSELSEKYSLNKTQIDYSLKKANQYLLENHIEPLKKENNTLKGRLTMMQLNLIIEKENHTGWLSEIERKTLIEFMLMLQNDTSLAHFSIDLKASKNTILNDLKDVKKSFEEQGIQLSYNRRKGYFLEGNEISIRRVLLKRIRETDRIKQMVVTTGFLEMRDAKFYHDFFKEIEEGMNIRLSDEMIERLPFIIEALLKRANNQHQLKDDDLIDLAVLKQEDSFQLLREIFEKNLPLVGVSEADISFLIIQILGASLVLSQVEPETYEKDPYYHLICEMVWRFENCMAIKFHQKEEIYLKFYQHIIPAIYRIKYDIPLANDLSTRVQQEYSYIHSIVRKVVDPLEQALQTTFPESELVYLTMLFVGLIFSQNAHIENKPKAVVLCENGLTESLLLTNVLREIFPEFVFIGYMSKRDFVKNEVPADVIFSTVYFDTEQNLFVVDPVINDEKKLWLRKNVLKKVRFFGPKQELMKKEQINQFIESIEPFVKIVDKKGLEAFLDITLQPFSLQLSTLSYYNKPSLVQLLPIEHIQVSNDSLTLEEAILLCSQPLIKNKIVEASYAERIIANYPKGESYFSIAPKVALPHTTGLGDVHSVGMSLLKLAEPIYFPNEGRWVSLLAVVAPLNNDMHINAVTQLHKIVLDDHNVEKLLNCRDAAEIKELIDQKVVELENARK